MSLEKLFYNSLQTIAESVANGEVGDINLIKASESYKRRVNHKPSKSYLLIKSKTFNNFINGIENSQTLMKALVVGETKVSNGVMYVVKQINSKKKGVYLDWRVANKQPKNLVDTDGNSGLFDIDDFPDLADIKIIKGLGGSTGAQLVEDKAGNQFVLKKGNSPAHVEEEYLVNSIYKLMGVDVPTMKLYKTKGGSLILSKFMDDTVDFNSVIDDQHIDDVTQNYVLDCLLANWDIYKNDNILIDNTTGKLVRVDNGGGLRFSAQGRDKGDHFTDEVDEIETMLVNNPHLAIGVTNTKITNQIKQIKKEKKKILALIDDPVLKAKMNKRITDLTQRLKTASKPSDPYRELSDKELDKAMKACGGDLWNSDYVEGWTFLSQIAKMRGFNDKPKVVDDAEFKKLLAQSDTLHVQRGLQGSGNQTARDYMTQFVESDHCFYGRTGIYGAGIYGAVNTDKDTKKINDVALAYANYQSQHIIDVVLPSDMKIIDSEELDTMMEEEFFGDEFKQVKKDYDNSVKELTNLQKDKETLENSIEKKIKDDLGWNEKVYDILLKSKPEEVYADTEKYEFKKILSYFTPILKSINGDIKKLSGNSYEVSIPNSSETFILAKETAELSLKQKNDKSIPYNYHYQRLKEFVMKNHFHNIKNVAEKTIEKERKENKNLLAISKQIDDATINIKALSDAVNKTKKDGSVTLNNVMSQIAKRPGGEFRGFYAAIKGYDAVIQKRSSGGGISADYCVILNRSKLIVKDFN